jgi:hypothetical protein
MRYIVNDVGLSLFVAGLKQKEFETTEQNDRLQIQNNK